MSAAVASALLFSNAYAAGLGKLTVLSALGQPLRAEIELTSVSKDEAGSLAAKLASVEAFRQANIEYNAALSSLRFAVEQRGDRQFVRVTSAQPLNEPFVDMLLELSGPNGRLVREYTFLLDPPDFKATQATPATAEAGGTRNVQPQTSSAPATTASRSITPAPAPTPRAERSAPSRAAESRPDAGGEYKVRSGDTLARIAMQSKPAGISLDQMLVALYQSNPDAFVGQNMNRLKAGQILSIPTADAARAVSNSEARGIVVAQAADFNNYRSKLAGQVAAGTPQKSSETKQSAGGKITAKVEERATPATESKDKLKLSNAASATGAAGDKAAGAGSDEDRIAKEKAIAEANSRVKELEKNVGELQKLLEVKNKSLAEQQKQADASKVAAKPEAPVVAQVAPSPAPAAPVAPVASAPAAAAPAAASSEVVAKAAEPSATDTKPSEPKAGEPNAAQAPSASAAPVAPAKPATPVPQPEISFVDSLLDNPMVIPGLGALLVALGALGVYRARSKKKDKSFEDSLIADSSLKTNSLFGSTGGQSVDTSNSVFNSSFSPSVSQLDSNEVDPVAEADVYIAYGRDAQAEEILKEALRTQPDRNAVRLKLLEIYSNRKDLRAFELLATELYGLTKGEGEDWAQAAALGIAIDPNNPLYAGGKKAETSSGMPTAMVAPTQPLDEQGLATLLATTQSDATNDTLDPLGADTSYFGNTALATETPLEPSAEAGFDPSSLDAKSDRSASEPEQAKELAPNDLDFNLDGMGMQGIAVPNTIPRPIPSEPVAELSSIDFDFLDTPKATDPGLANAPEIQPVASAANQVDEFAMPDPLPEMNVEAPKPEAPVSSIDDLVFSLSEQAPVIPKLSEEPTLELGRLDVSQPGPENSDPHAIDIPDLDILHIEQPASAFSASAPASTPSNEIDPLDFDLSGISLELPPSDAAARSGLSMDSDMLTSFGEDSFSNSAEMATKLDLAVAYQEIGDKEGARELLDEVMKGGTPEQSEKARSLLLELA